MGATELNRACKTESKVLCCCMGAIELNRACVISARDPKQASVGIWFLMIFIIPAKGALYKGGHPPDFDPFKKLSKWWILLNLKAFGYDNLHETSKTNLHAHSQLCSSRVALFQANFIFFVDFLNLWIDNFTFFGWPRHHFAHLDYMGGAPPRELCQFASLFTGFCIEGPFLILGCVQFLSFRRMKEWRIPQIWP